MSTCIPSLTALRVYDPTTQVGVSIKRDRGEEPPPGWAKKPSLVAREAAADEESNRLALAKNYAALARFPWMQTPPWRSSCPIDFTIENPASSKLWLQTCVRDLYDPQWSELWNPEMNQRLLDRTVQYRLVGRYPCTRLTTTYCKYGTDYKKPTTILTSVSAIGLKPVCSKEQPCAVSSETYPVHPRTVQDVVGRGERNQLPASLTHDLLEAFCAKHRAQGAKAFLVIDVFSGWGSVSRAVEQFATTLPPDERIIVYTNDIIKNRALHSCNLDIDVGKTIDPLDILVRFALVTTQATLEEVSPHRLYLDKNAGEPVSQVMRNAGVACLLHCSFPCTTYSTAAGSTHRSAGERDPTSGTGLLHDTMLCELLGEINALCQLTPPGPPAPLEG